MSWGTAFDFGKLSSYVSSAESWLNEAPPAPAATTSGECRCSPESLHSTRLLLDYGSIDRYSFFWVCPAPVVEAAADTVVEVASDVAAKASQFFDSLWAASEGTVGTSAPTKTAVAGDGLFC